MSEAYGALDRMLHRIVFGSTAITETAVDIEETLFAKFYQDAPPPRPIFVTSLARRHDRAA